MDGLIERLASEAGLAFGMRAPARLTDMGDGTMRLRSPACPTPYEEGLRRFAALVAEECAKVADGHAQAAWERDRSKACARAAFDASAAIRAKFKMP
jgi:hypothetical protein